MAVISETRDFTIPKDVLYATVCSGEHGLNAETVTKAAITMFDVSLNHVVCSFNDYDNKSCVIKVYYIPR